MGREDPLFTNQSQTTPGGKPVTRTLLDGEEMGKKWYPRHRYTESFRSHYFRRTPHPTAMTTVTHCLRKHAQRRARAGSVALSLAGHWWGWWPIKRPNQVGIPERHQTVLGMGEGMFPIDKVNKMFVCVCFVHLCMSVHIPMHMYKICFVG